MSTFQPTDAKKNQQLSSQSSPITKTLPSASPPLKRTRAKRSCDFCRKRKSRCDADTNTPCSNCKAWGYTCEFQTVRKKRGPPSVYVDNLEKRCKKMELLLTSLTKSSIRDLERANFEYNVEWNSPALPPIQSDSSSEDDEDDTDDFDPVSDIQQHMTTLNIKDYDSIKYTGHSAGLSLADQDIFKSKTFVHWPGRNDVVLQMMAQDELMIVRTDPTGNGKPDKRLDVGLSMHSAIFDGPQAQTCRKPATERPPHHLIDQMIGFYFCKVHPFLPIVSRSRFLDQYHRKSTNGPPSVLLYAVLAISFRMVTLERPETVANATDYADYYFRKVMKQLRDTLRSRLCHVQAALLMTLYLDMDDGDVESVQWFTLGSAIRMAQDLGLHRSSEHWNLPPSEIETRHRVFYACYVFDRWFGARAGKPLTILDRDFDTAMPSPYEVTDTGTNTGDPIYRPFVLFIKLSEILGRVLKALYAPKAKKANSNAGLDDPTIRVVFDQRLKNWKASLDEPVDGIHISLTEKAALQILHNIIVLLLHRPFIQLSPQQFPELQRIAAESRKVCTETACQISDTLLRCHAQKTLPTEPNPLLCLQSYMVYGMFQSSLIHLSNVLKQDSSTNRHLLQQSMMLVEKHKHVSSAPRVLEILKMLINVNGLSLNGDAPPVASQKPSAPSPSPTMHSTPQAQHSTAQLHKIQPVPEEEYPKSNHLFQRMLNCSVVGGITPDIRHEVELAMRHQPVDCFLPQPEPAPLTMAGHPSYMSTQPPNFLSHTFQPSPHTSPAYGTLIPSQPQHQHQHQQQQQQQPLSTTDSFHHLALRQQMPLHPQPPSLTVMRAPHGSGAPAELATNPSVVSSTSSFSVFPQPSPLSSTSISPVPPSNMSWANWHMYMGESQNNMLGSPHLTPHTENSP